MDQPQIVFRGGSRTNQMLTPRPGIDTVAPEGLTPGLSVEETLQDALEERNKKAQKIDRSKLKPPLAYFADDANVKGGRLGHGVITPVDATGRVDHAAL